MINYSRICPVLVLLEIGWNFASWMLWFALSRFSKNGASKSACVTQIWFIVAPNEHINGIIDCLREWKPGTIHVIAYQNKNWTNVIKKFKNPIWVLNYSQLIVKPLKPDECWAYLKKVICGVKACLWTLSKKWCVQSESLSKKRCVWSETLGALTWMASVDAIRWRTFTIIVVATGLKLQR